MMMYIENVNPYRTKVHVRKCNYAGSGPHYLRACKSDSGLHCGPVNQLGGVRRSRDGPRPGHL